MSESERDDFRVTQVKGRRRRNGEVQYCIQYSTDKNSRGHWLTREEILEKDQSAQEKIDNFSKENPILERKEYTTRKIDQIIGIVDDGKEPRYVVLFQKSNEPEAVDSKILHRFYKKMLLDFLESKITFKVDYNKLMKKSGTSQNCPNHMGNPDLLNTQTSAESIANNPPMMINNNDPQNIINQNSSNPMMKMTNIEKPNQIIPNTTINSPNMMIMKNNVENTNKIIMQSSINNPNQMIMQNSMGNPTQMMMQTNINNPNQMIMQNSMGNPTQMMMQTNPNQMMIQNSMGNPNQIMMQTNPNPNQMIMQSNINNPNQMIMQNNSNPNSLIMQSNINNPNQMILQNNITNPNPMMIQNTIGNPHSIMMQNNTNANPMIMQSNIHNPNQMNMQIPNDKDPTETTNQNKRMNVKHIIKNNNDYQRDINEDKLNQGNMNIPMHAPSGQPLYLTNTYFEQRPHDLQMPQQYPNYILQQNQPQIMNQIPMNEYERFTNQRNHNP